MLEPSEAMKIQIFHYNVRHYAFQCYAKTKAISKLATQTRTRASRREVMLEECSSFKSVFKQVSQPLLTGDDSKSQLQMERMSYWQNFIKKDNYGSFASSPRSNRLLRARMRQNTQNGLRAQSRFGSICSVEEAIQENKAKTDQTVWMRRLISLRRALLSL